MPATLPLNQLPSWQEQLADLISDPLVLLEMLDLSPAQVGFSELALREFPLRVPRGYAALMERGNPLDPLLLQVLPASAELLDLPGYEADPLGEMEATVVPGLLHKYQGRVLLIVTQACAIHCRYCFRRHFPYAENRQSRAQWETALRYIAEREDIREVILSGGDPLASSNQHLAWLLSRLRDIAHIKRIRLHTRLPIVLPDRVDDALLDLLNDDTRQIVMVLHANHANEISPQVAQACRSLRSTGLTLLNQTVLLKGINNSAVTLGKLSEVMFAAGVLPYYLHLPDPVKGTAHFVIHETEAQAIISRLQATLPGYLVPRLVVEVAGRPAKTPL